MKLLLALFAGLALTSCSLTYSRDWKAAAKFPATTEPKDLTGAWEGTWRSIKTGHHGTLKAIVTRQPASPASTPPAGTPKQKTKPSAPTPVSVDYAFRYHATWAKILSGGYTTSHTVSPSGQVTGEHDLGKLMGGVYRYKGQASPDHFKAEYDCSLDHGVFELRRPRK